MKKQHIIFDMDGTLSNTAIATEAAIRMVEKQHDIPYVSLADVHGAMGLGGLEFHKKLFPTLPMETLLAVEKAVDAIEDENIASIGTAILFTGVYDMLAKLRSQGHTLYIASTGSAPHVETTLTAGNIKDMFAQIHCDQPQKKDMVREIIAGGDPSNWVMVGDMFKDSEAARANNITAIGAAFGYLAKGDYELFDHILQTPEDIFAYV